MLKRVVDVSKWQGTIPWPKFLDAALAGVYIKSSEGLAVDPEYSINLLQCRQVAMLPGAYHFLRPEVDPIKQAQLLFNMAPRMDTDMPPAVDVELDMRDGLDQWLKLTSPQERLDVVHAFCQAVASLFGRMPRVYISAIFVASHLPKNHGLGIYPLWVAAYPFREAQSCNFVPTWNPAWLPVGWQDWEMWQYGQIKLPGVGIVDASLLKDPDPKPAAGRPS
jgi:GH25 family lysozyme M1 (1,4-beta-N-acetylmuramidase)